MATIKFGAIVTDMRGKLGGHVFQKGNQSSVLKTYAKPRRNVSRIKAITQNIVNEAIEQYTALSFEEKEQWQAEAVKHVRKNRFGDPVAYTGRQLFLYLYNNLANSGQTLPPTLNNFDSSIIYDPFTGFELNVTTGTWISYGEPFGVSSRAILKVFKSRNPKLQINPIKSTYLANTNRYDFARTSYFDLLEEYYGSVNLGDNIYCVAAQVNPSGFRGAWQIQKADIIS